MNKKMPESLRRIANYEKEQKRKKHAYTSEELNKMPESLRRIALFENDEYRKQVEKARKEAEQEQKLLETARRMEMTGVQSMMFGSKRNPGIIKSPGGATPLLPYANSEHIVSAMNSAIDNNGAALSAGDYNKAETERETFGKYAAVYGKSLPAQKKDEFAEQVSGIDENMKQQRYISEAKNMSADELSDALENGYFEAEYLGAELFSPDDEARLNVVSHEIGSMNSLYVLNRDGLYDDGLGNTLSVKEYDEKLQSLKNEKQQLEDKKKNSELKVSPFMMEISRVYDLKKFGEPYGEEWFNAEGELPGLDTAKKILEDAVDEFYLSTNDPEADPPQRWIDIRDALDAGEYDDNQLYTKNADGSYMILGNDIYTFTEQDLIRLGLMYDKEPQKNHFSKYYENFISPRESQKLSVEMIKDFDELAKSENNAFKKTVGVVGGTVTSLGAKLAGAPEVLVNAAYDSFTKPEGYRSNPYKNGVYAWGHSAGAGAQRIVDVNAERAFGKTGAYIASSAYSIGTSVVDNVLTTALFGKAAPAVMAAKAGADTAFNAQLQGAKSGDVMKLAVASAAAEYLGEKVDIKMLEKSVKRALMTNDSMFKAMLKTAPLNMTSEFINESATEIMNIASEWLILENASEAAKAIDDAYASGKYDSKVLAGASYIFQRVLEAGIAGAISGGILSGGSIASYYANPDFKAGKPLGNVIKSEGGLDVLLSVAKGSKNKHTAEFAAELSDAVSKGKTASSRAVGTLANAVMEDVENGNITDNSINEKIKNWKIQAKLSEVQTEKKAKGTKTEISDGILSGSDKAVGELADGADFVKNITDMALASEDVELQEIGRALSENSLSGDEYLETLGKAAKKLGVTGQQLVESLAQTFRERYENSPDRDGMYFEEYLRGELSARRKAGDEMGARAVELLMANERANFENDVRAGKVSETFGETENAEEYTDEDFEPFFDDYEEFDFGESVQKAEPGVTAVQSSENADISSDSLGRNGRRQFSRITEQYGTAKASEMASAFHTFYNGARNGLSFEQVKNASSAVVQNVPELVLRSAFFSGQNDARHEAEAQRKQEAREKRDKRKGKNVDNGNNSSYNRRDGGTIYKKDSISYDAGGYYGEKESEGSSSDAVSKRRFSRSSEGGNTQLGKGTRRFIESARKRSERTQYAAKLRKQGKLKTGQVIEDIVCDVVPEEHYSKDMRSVAKTNAGRGIHRTVFVSGELKVEDVPGEVFYADGAYIEDENGIITVIIQCDNYHHTPKQINDHEYIHKNFSTSLVQKAKDAILHSLSARERAVAFEVTARNLKGLSKITPTLIQEELTANVLSGMDYVRFGNQFDELRVAFWNGDVAFIEKFNKRFFGRKYNIDSILLKQSDIPKPLKPGDIFPVGSGAEAGAISTIWANNDGIKHGARKVVSHRGRRYVIVKDADSDVKYRILRCISSREFSKRTNRIKEVKTNGKDNRGDSRGIATYTSDNKNRRNDWFGGRQSISDSGVYKYDGKAETTGGLAGNQDGGRSIGDQRDRTDERSLLRNNSDGRISGDTGRNGRGITDTDIPKPLKAGDIFPVGSGAEAGAISTIWANNDDVEYGTFKTVSHRGQRYVIVKDADSDVKYSIWEHIPSREFLENINEIKEEKTYGKDNKGYAGEKTSYTSDNKNRRNDRSGGRQPISDSGVYKHDGKAETAGGLAGNQDSGRSIGDQRDRTDERGLQNNSERRVSGDIARNERGIKIRRFSSSRSENELYSGDYRLPEISDSDAEELLDYIDGKYSKDSAEYKLAKELTRLEKERRNISGKLKKTVDAFRIKSFAPDSEKVTEFANRIAERLGFEKNIPNVSSVKNSLSDFYKMMESFIAGELSEQEIASEARGIAGDIAEVSKEKSSGYNDKMTNISAGESLSVTTASNNTITSNDNVVNNNEDTTYDFGITQREINTYVDKAYSKENNKSYLKFLEADDSLIDAVSSDVDISGYVHALRDNDIRHIKNSHGEATNEKYPVTSSDIQMIPFIVEHYDKVFYKTNANGAPGLVYVKVMPDNVVYYVEAITQEYGKEKLLVNKQMIKTGINEIPNLVGLNNAINKKQSNSQYLADLQEIRKAYVQDVKESYSNNSISQNPSAVNRGGNHNRFTENLAAKLISSYLQVGSGNTRFSLPSIETLTEKVFSCEEELSKICESIPDESIEELRKNGQALKAQLKSIDAELEGQKKKTPYARLMAAQDEVFRELSEREQAAKEKLSDYKADRREREQKEKLLRVIRELRRAKTDKETRALIDELYGKYDTVGISISEEGLLNLSDLKADYESERENNPNFIPSKKTEREIERLSKVQIGNMSASEVAITLEEAMALSYGIKNQNFIIEKGERRSARKAADEGIAAVRNSGGMKYENGALRAAGKFDMSLLSPARFFKKILGYDTNNEFYKRCEALNDGQRKAAAIRQDCARPFEALVSSKDKKEDKRLKAELREFTGEHAREYDIGIISAKGKHIYITPAQKVALYLSAENPDFLRHAFGGGITFPDITLLKKGKLQEAYARGEKVILSPSEIARITSELTEYEKAWADAAREFFNVKSKKYVNEASELLYGYEIANVENYFPINVSRNYIATEFESLVRDGTLEGKGMLKERTENNLPVNLEDVTSVLNRHISDVSAFAGLAVPIRNFQTVYNAYSYEWDDSLKGVIEKKWGPDANKYIENLITDFQSPRKSDEGFFGFLDKLRSLRAAAIMSVNIPVTLGNLAAYPQAAGALGWEAVGAASTNREKIKFDEELVGRYSPLYNERRSGFTVRELGDIRAQGNIIHRTSALERAFGMMQGVDLVVTRRIWIASEYYVRKNSPGLSVGSNEYYKAVAEIFNRTLEETQPMYSVYQRPEILRSTNVFTRELTMFKSALLQNYNVMYDSVAEYRAVKKNGSSDDVTKAGKKMMNVLSSQVAAGLVVALMNLTKIILTAGTAYRDDEDELTALSVATGFGKDFVSNFTSMIPGLDDSIALCTSLIEAFGVDIPGNPEWYDLNASAFEMINSFKTSIESVISASLKYKTGEVGAKSVSKAVYKLAESVSQMLGIPLKNTVGAFWNTVCFGAEAFGGKHYGDYIRLKMTGDAYKSSTLGDMMKCAYAAYAEDDMDTYKKIKSDMINSGYISNDKFVKKMKSFEKEEKFNLELERFQSGELPGNKVSDALIKELYENEINKAARRLANGDKDGALEIIKKVSKKSGIPEGRFRVIVNNKAASY